MRRQAEQSRAHLLEGEGHMAHYLFQGGYAPEAWAGLIENPEDRTAVVRAALESIGGTLNALYYTFGADDFVGFVEAPDHIQAAAVSIAVASTGRYRNFRLTPLLTAQEMVQAMQGAGKVSFRPAGRI
jgi:uncharacterized protein with GYD domain